MSEMVERVAKAMYEAMKVAAEESRAGTPYVGDFSANATILDGDFDLEKIATAAIEAMREPTTDMLLSGQGALGEAIIASHKPGVSVPIEYKLAAIEPHHTKAEWQAMIDEALKE